MNDDDIHEADPLMRVIGQHLEQSERMIDVRVLADQILDQAGFKPISPDSAAVAKPVLARRRFRVSWTVGLGSLAAAAAVLFVSLAVLSPAAVRAEQTIREAEAALRLPVERCYLVEVRPDEGAATDEPLPSRTMRVWAAADRFRVEMNRGSYRWCWGRDTDGTVWFVAGPQRGLRIAPDEQGPAVQWACELFGLRLESLLTHILAHCQLREDRRTGAGYPSVIYAEPRAGARQAWLKSATLELDAETKAIRKLTLVRQNKDGAGTSTVTFTLVESRPIEDARYRLEGHLTEPFQVFDRDFEPARRREILSRWVGTKVDGWLRPTPQKKAAQGETKP